MKSSNPSYDRPGFKTFFKEDGKYYFQFNDENEEPVLFSKGYATAEARDGDIDVVIQVGGRADHFELKKSKNGRCYFILFGDDQREIGRSRLFATRKEMDKRMGCLKNLNADTPVSAETTPSSPEEPAPQQENTGRHTPKAPAPPSSPAAEKPVVQTPAPPAPKPEPAATRPAEAEEEPGKMTRYKFSIIYYPDSAVWKLVNDFTGESAQMNTYDTKQIERFLKAHLPAGVVIPEGPPQISMPSEKSVARPSASIAAVKRNAPGSVILTIQTEQGEPLQKLHQLALVKKIKAVPSASKGDSTAPFDAHIKARSLSDNKIYPIGNVVGQMPVDGRFEIPAAGLLSLKPGAYMFVAKIYQRKGADEPVEFYGSQFLAIR